MKEGRAINPIKQEAPLKAPEVDETAMLVGNSLTRF